MPSAIHEIAVARLGQDPALLPALAEKLLGRPAPAALPLADSTVRLADPEEVRPDLILAEGPRGPWNVIEVQRRIDRGKAVRWPLLVSLLHAQRGCAGDLWVLTASRRTAEWAESACDARGPHGTRATLSPIVLLVGPDQIEALLDEERPSLAFFAAWAMHGRHGRAAARVIERALAITARLPKGLRRKQGKDIFNVLHRRMIGTLRERNMNVDTYVGPFLREWQRLKVAEIRVRLTAEIKAAAIRAGRAQAKAEAKIEAKREAVLMVMGARGLSISTAQKAEIAGCSKLATLDGWLVGASQAATVAEALATAPRKRSTPAKGQPRRASRSPRSSSSSPKPRAK